MSAPPVRTLDEFDAHIARVLNAASVGAQEAILEFAQRFDRREDYRPLEELAHDVMRQVLEAGLERWREIREDGAA